MKIFVIILMGLTLSACGDGDTHKYRMACLDKGGVLEYKLAAIKEENTRYGDKYLKPEYYYSYTLPTK